MKNLTKKLFISVLSLLLVLVALGTSTFAWFTLGTEAKIENVKVNVTTGTGMEISTNGTTWTNKISLADNTVDFKDVTTSDGITLKKMLSGAYENATANTDYFEMTLYVRLTTTDSAVDFSRVVLKSITGSDKEFSTNDDKWLADVTFSGEEKTYTTGQYYNFDALNAVKISFITIRNSNPTCTLLYGYENNNNQGDVSLTGISKAYANAKEYSSPNYWANGNAQVGTEGQEGYVAFSEGSYPTQVKKDKLNTNDATVLLSTDFGAFSTLGLANTIVGDDADYKYAKLTIKVWLEGWDADCINAILEQGTSFSFALEAKKDN